jgi:general secretion pathway protein M
MKRFDLASLFPTFAPAWGKAAGWWQARSGREQWLLGVAGVLLAGWLLAVTVILPIQRARAAALADIRTYEALTARLHEAGPLGASPPQASGPPQAILSSSAAPFGILPVVNSDAAGLRVIIAEAPYDAVMRWIAAVEQTSSLRVTKLRLTRRPASGFVSAELVVRA